VDSLRMSNRVSSGGVRTESERSTEIPQMSVTQFALEMMEAMSVHHCQML